MRIENRSAGVQLDRLIFLLDQSLSWFNICHDFKTCFMCISTHKNKKFIYLDLVINHLVGVSGISL